MQKQSAIERYRAIIKYHGLFRGLRRVADQITQVDAYDWRHGLNTKDVMLAEEFARTTGSDGTAAMFYQPVFTKAVRDPLLHLVKNFPIVGASSTAFLDLGCGRGKPLHVASQTIQHATLIGVDLHPDLLKDASRNLGVEDKDSPKVKLILQNVNDVDYKSLLAPFDCVIAFNRNSFDKNTTENTRKLLVDACQGKALFYIYSNPVFEDLFKSHELVHEMSGWHKGWNTKTFRLV